MSFAINQSRYHCGIVAPPFLYDVIQKKDGPLIAQRPILSAGGIAGPVHILL